MTTQLIKLVLLAAATLIVVRQCRKPSWLPGRLIIKGMDRGHRGMTDWALHGIPLENDFTRHRSGRRGVSTQDVRHDELFPALRAVGRGERYLAPVVTQRLMARWQQPPRTTLTERELQVLHRVARGDGNKNIAHALGIAEPTVKAHLVHIFEKLSVDNRTAAARVAHEQGLIASA